MIKNNLLIALRLMWKHKAFSVINIFGLAVSMSVCLLVIMLIKDMNSFDEFHPNGDRIYRINTTAIRKSGNAESYASSPYPVGKTLAENYADVEEEVRLVNLLNGEVTVDGKQLPSKVFLRILHFLTCSVSNSGKETPKTHFRSRFPLSSPRRPLPNCSEIRTPWARC